MRSSSCILKNRFSFGPFPCPSGWTSRGVSCYLKCNYFLGGCNSIQKRNIFLSRKQGNICSEKGSLLPGCQGQENLDPENRLEFQLLIYLFFNLKPAEEKNQTNRGRSIQQNFGCAECSVLPNNQFPNVIYMSKFLNYVDFANVKFEEKRHASSDF